MEARDQAVLLYTARKQADSNNTKKSSQGGQAKRAAETPPSITQENKKIKSVGKPPA
jgi:hypothetical protein